MEVAKGTLRRALELAPGDQSVRLALQMCAAIESKTKESSAAFSKNIFGGWLPRPAVSLPSVRPTASSEKVLLEVMFARRLPRESLRICADFALGLASTTGQAKGKGGLYPEAPKLSKAAGGSKKAR